MVTNKSKRYFFLDSYTLFLCWMHCRSASRGSVWLSWQTLCTAGTQH